MTDLPEPLTPPDSDLRDFTFMPLDVVRLMDSDLFALSTGDEFKAAVALWCKSWTQIPAASLPSDPRVLAHLSGAGSRWAKVKSMALRGWVECSDGRIYHPVVAEKALDALERKGKGAGDREKNAEKMRKWREAKRRKNGGGDDHGEGNEPNVKPERDGNGRPSRNRSHDPSHDPSRDDQRDGNVTSLIGQGQRQGQGQKEETPPSGSLRARDATGTRLPEDWTPSPADIAFATGLGLVWRDIAAYFRDYWRAQPGAKGRKSDWHATWCNWCRREAERRKPTFPSGGSRPSNLSWQSERAAPTLELEPEGSIS